MTKVRDCLFLFMLYACLDFCESLKRGYGVILSIAFLLTTREDVVYNYDISKKICLEVGVGGVLL